MTLVPCVFQLLYRCFSHICPYPSQFTSVPHLVQWLSLNTGVPSLCPTISYQRHIIFTAVICSNTSDTLLTLNLHRRRLKASRLSSVRGTSRKSASQAASSCTPNSYTHQTALGIDHCLPSDFMCFSYMR